MVFNTDGFAKQDFIQKVYLSDVSGEYIGSADVLISEGTGLPAGAHIDTPPAAEEGQVVVRAEDGSKWILVRDYRGKTIYATDKSTCQVVTAPGDIPEGFTLSGPPAAWQVWNGEAWEADATALKTHQQAEAAEKKGALMNKASNDISLLQDAVDLDMATEKEAAKLIALKRYRVLLNRLDVATAPDITWPEAPGE
ncbi:tail fiber assembly protein [Cronobacter dublinensis]|uniref:tail fiber assembly protein n=1 Tax=Cronobacter dublinensis TaxID=413497 RepID=UPI0024AECAFC|nr:tail fiber assembly protein [Cronobacter dublinensis]MDI7502360.1 tail fiber assembly protein [Cronobacter dublinensis]